MSALGAAAYDLEPLAPAHELCRRCARAKSLQQIREADAKRGGQTRERIQARHGIARLQATQHGTADTCPSGYIPQRQILCDAQAPRDLADVLPEPGALRVARTARGVLQTHSHAAAPVINAL